MSIIVDLRDDIKEYIQRHGTPHPRENIGIGA